MGKLTLRQARRLRKMRQEDLAAKARVDQSTLSNYETGKIAQPRPRTLKRIARALAMPPERLIFGAPPAASTPAPTVEAVR